jgi:hypothetical protein
VRADALVLDGSLDIKRQFAAARLQQDGATGERQ